MIQKSNLFSGMSGFFIQNRNFVVYSIMTVALIGFEMFNYSTTQYALSDLLGQLTFAGLQWATILSIAFCGIDFAGIARLFTPDGDSDPTREVWYLFGAWLLAATMNALLTWWGVSMALQGRELHSAAIIDKKLMMQAVPIFVAVMVWVTRVLLIGSFSLTLRHNQLPAQNRPTGPYRSAQPSLRQAGQATSNPLPQPSQISTPQYQRTPQPAAASSLNRAQVIAAPSSTPARPTPPVRLEPEYIPDGEAHPVSAPLPALRPMSAGPRPSGPNQERRF